MEQTRTPDQPQPALGIVKPHDEVLYLYPDGSTEVSQWPPCPSGEYDPGDLVDRCAVARRLERTTSIPHYYYHAGRGYCRKNRTYTRRTDLLDASGCQIDPELVEGIVRW